MAKHGSDFPKGFRPQPKPRDDEPFHSPSRPQRDRKEPANFQPQPQNDNKSPSQPPPSPHKDRKDPSESSPSPQKDRNDPPSPQKDRKDPSESSPSPKKDRKDPPQPPPSPPKDDDKDRSRPSPSPPKDDKDSSDSPPPTKGSKSPPPPDDNDDSSPYPPPPQRKDPRDPKKSNDNDDFQPPPPPPWSTPPPPKSDSPPPPPISTSQRESPSDKKEVSTQTKFIIGGFIIGGALLLIFAMICWLACCKRKRGRKARDQMLYRDNSTGNRSSDYYNGPSHWNNEDHAMKIPPVTTGPPSQVSSGNWPDYPPPPPPQAMSSSEVSSVGFSNGPREVPLPPPHPSFVLGYSQSQFSLEELTTATGGFSKANLLGQGGFGYVYKGVLPNGKEVAVKSLKAGSGQGEREFQAEMEVISRVHHRHLVRLVGYCVADDKRMLVYEFVPNNSLEHHLHGKGQPVLDFPSRLKIALGSAKGFTYLHEDCDPRIIHRDIKAANILLDYNYEAKVADFGLAKLSNDNYTHVSTRIMGTLGYLAPEYASSGKLTEKSDVYSFGIVLLELITGKRPVDIHNPEEDSLVDWARPIIEEAVEGEEYEELVDPKLNGEYDPHEMLRMIACAAACIRPSAKNRPKMIQIARALEGDALLADLNEGMQKSSSSVFSSGSSEYESSYTPRKKRSRRQSNNSQELTSSEFGNTGEFSSQPSPLKSIGNSQEFIRKLNL